MSDRKRKITWSICLIFVIVLSTACLIGLQRIGGDIATEFMVNSLLNDSTVEDGASIYALWKSIALISGAIILTLATIVFYITCKRRSWNAKQHGLGFMIIGTILRWIGMGSISEILFLFAIIKIFKQARQEE